MRHPHVSIIMPIRNEAAYIVGCLNSVLSQDYPVDRMEILIADGMSNDNTRLIIRKISEGIQVPVIIIDNPSRIVATGMNLAIRRAKGDIIVRVDGHTSIEPDYVRRCVETIKRTQADNAGGLMNAVGSNLFGRAVALGTSTPFGIGGARFHYSDKEEWVDTVYMGAWPRDVFQRVGMFDEEMIRNQDDEFNYRLRKAGGRIFLSPKIKSTYNVRSTLPALWRQYFQYGFWKVRVLQKLPGQMSARQFAPPTLALALLFSSFLAWSSYLLPSSVISRLPALVVRIPFSLFTPMTPVVLSPTSALLLLSLVVPSLYLFANLSASGFIAAKKGFRYYPLLPFVFATLHIGYGMGFLAGLLKFWNRWGQRGREIASTTGKTEHAPASRAAEVARDHPAGRSRRCGESCDR